jgi:hypothetical protein
MRADNLGQAYSQILYFGSARTVVYLLHPDQEVLSRYSLMIWRRASVVSGAYEQMVESRRANLRATCGPIWCTRVRHSAHQVPRFYWIPSGRWAHLIGLTLLRRLFVAAAPLTYLDDETTLSAIHR